jgi:hypothetical protein
MFELLHEMDCCDFELNVVRLISEYEPLSDEWELYESGAENTAPELFQYLTHDEKELILFLGVLHLKSVLGENIESFFQERVTTMLNKVDEEA